MASCWPGLIIKFCHQLYHYGNVNLYSWLLLFFISQSAIQYQEWFLAPMLQYITDRSPEVRQAAAYGCGVMGKFGGPQFAQACLRKSFLRGFALLQIYL